MIFVEDIEEVCILAIVFMIAGNRICAIGALKMTEGFETLWNKRIWCIFIKYIPYHQDSIIMFTIHPTDKVINSLEIRPCPNMKIRNNTEL